MRLEFTLDADDYDAFHIDYRRTSSEGRSAARIGRWGLPTLIVGIVLVLVARNGYDPVWTPVMLGYAASWILAFPRLVRFASVRRNRRWAARNADSAAFAPRNMEFTADGIRAVAGEASSAVGWGAVQRLSRGPKHLFVYLDTRQALVVPFRACHGESGAEDLAASCARWHAQASQVR